MNMAIGIVLSVLGIVCILWGDKALKVREGIILRRFSWPRGYVKWMKWPMGAAILYAGVRLIMHG